jgi:hypothetical protein
MYIDPNSGGLLFQVLLVILGAFTGAVFLFYGRIKMGIARLRRSLREKRAGRTPSDSTPDP